MKLFAYCVLCVVLIQEECGSPELSVVPLKILKITIVSVTQLHKFMGNLRCQTSLFMAHFFSSCVHIHSLYPHRLCYVLLQQVSRVVERQSCDGRPPLVDDSGVHRHRPALCVGPVARFSSAPAWFVSACPAVESLMLNKLFSWILIEAGSSQSSDKFSLSF